MKLLLTDWSVQKKLRLGKNAFNLKTGSFGYLLKFSLSANNSCLFCCHLEWICTLPSTPPFPSGRRKASSYRTTGYLEIYKRYLVRVASLFTICCRSGRRKATLYHTTGYLKYSKRCWAHVVTSQFADAEKRHRILQLAIWKIIWQHYLVRVVYSHFAAHLLRPYYRGVICS